jgi:hypothetical protein
VLFNDHDLEGDDPVVAIISEANTAPSVAPRAVSRLKRALIESTGYYCVPCSQITRDEGLIQFFGTKEELLYHMKAKYILSPILSGYE